MSTFKTLASLAVLAAGTAAALILTKKNGTETAVESEKIEEKTEPVPAAELSSGSYSFMAGYSTVRACELTMDYDAEKYSFDVVEDMTLNDSNVSHAAIIHGEKLDMQIEYSEFYPGEGFEEFCTSCRERYNDCEELCFGENKFLKYLDGDALVLCLPVNGNSECCVLISVFKAKDNDDKLGKLLEYADVMAMLTSVKTTAE